MKRLMMIGFGAMAEEVLRHLPEELKLSWVVTTERSVERVKQAVAVDVQVMTSVAECDEDPDLVLEWIFNDFHRVSSFCS